MSLPSQLEAVEAVADAVMCEGEVLYPYRASAGKNRLRWQFGVITPRAFTEREESDRWSMRTSVLLDGPAPEVLVRARFVTSVRRSVVVDGERVASATVDGQLFTSFDESVPHVLDCRLPVGAARTVTFDLPAARSVEPLSSAVALARSNDAVSAELSVAADPVPGPYGLVRVTARLTNTGAWAPPAAGSHPRSSALASSLIAGHMMLAAPSGRWLSATDPPEFAAALLSGADQEGCWPVLVGSDDRVVLAAPIILGDHPEVSPESAGDFCDATEIDEILALRVLTLTDDEKREARATDVRAAAILDRCDTMPNEVWSRLHGAVRSLRPTQPAPDTVDVGGVDVGPGTAVVLKPARSADAQDLFLVGRRATVHQVQTDLDGEVHISVVLDDDPGSDLLEWYGRYRYFKPHEVEPLP